MRTFITIMLVTFLFTNCTKEDNLSIDRPIEQRLSFSNKEEVLAIINGDKNSNKKISLPTGFVSLISSRKEQTTTKDGNNTDAIYYETEGYDTLVPNTNLAMLLNKDGEIRVGEYIYKIAPEGTYFFLPSKELRFNELYQNHDKTGTQVEDKLYMLEEGIYRFDTFKGSYEYVEDESCESIASFNNNQQKSFYNDFAGIPISTFKTHNADPHTWVGKAWSSLFGENIAYTTKLRDNRRLKGKFYSYDYVFYSEIGVMGEMQKKNWIGWSGTDANELIIGWTNVRITVDIPTNISKFMPKDLAPTFIDATHTYIPGLNNKGWNVCILGYHVSDEEIFKAAKQGIKPLVKHLNSLTNGSGINTSEPISEDKLDAVTIINRHRITTIIPMDAKRSTNKEKIREVFRDDISIGLSIDLLDLPANALEWGQALYNGMSQLPKPELKSGEVFVCGRLGATWGGMRIVKN